jgi:hypothetical protein
MYLLVHRPFQQACPANAMGRAMELCVRSLGSTMEALQQASLLCDMCPEVAATEQALSRAEQLMAATIKKVRLTLNLVTIKQQQRQEQQVQQVQLPWVGAAAGMALPPHAAVAAAAKVPPVAAAAAAAEEYCDPSTADSACSSYVGQLVLPQLLPVELQGGVNMPLLHAQQQQQQYSQDAKHFAQQGADAQEEVASSWE